MVDQAWKRAVKIRAVSCLIVFSSVFCMHSGRKEPSSPPPGCYVPHTSPYSTRVRLTFISPPLVHPSSSSSSSLATVQMHLLFQPGCKAEGALGIDATPSLAWHRHICFSLPRTGHPWTRRYASFFPRLFFSKNTKRKQELGTNRSNVALACVHAVDLACKHNHPSARNVVIVGDRLS